MEVEKTPVTILQELMTKIKSIPQYEFHDGKEHTSKIFMCQVTCDGITAVGSGKSKKDAKQCAATSMLEKMGKRKMLQSPSRNCESPVKKVGLSQTQNTFSSNNYVLDLDRQCYNYKISDPIYKDMEVLNDGRTKSFIVQCSVSNLKTEGMGSMKKHAKNNAAKKMLDELKDFFQPGCSKQNENEKTANESVKSPTANSNCFPVAVANDFIKLKINYDLKLQSERKELVKNLKVAVPNILSKLNHMSDIISECQKNMKEENITKIKVEFQALLDLAKIDFHHMLLQTVEPVTYMLIIQLNTVPDILEMSLGGSRKESELRTINKIIETLKSMIYQNSV